jgi:5'-nucleotidase/UDP-sugar diphosphatase
MSEPIEVGSTFIVSANNWGRYIGHGRLNIHNGRIVSFIWAPIPIGPDPEVLAMLEPFIEEANASLKEEIGTASGEFFNDGNASRRMETAIGNMVSDACVWYFTTRTNQNIDFAFINGGGIRASLPAGPITREGILTVLPFNNIMVVASIRGSYLIELFNFIANTHGSGAFPQFSGEVRYSIDKTGSEPIIRNLTIGGAPVDPDRIYRFSTNDYLMGGGDGYTALENVYERYNSMLVTSYIVMEYIKMQGTINPTTDGRLTIIE